MRTLPGASRCVQEQSVSDYGLSDQIVRVACIHFIFFLLSQESTVDHLQRIGWRSEVECCGKQVIWASQAGELLLWVVPLLLWIRHALGYKR
jgi:hypothetical protein